MQIIAPEEYAAMKWNLKGVAGLVSITYPDLDIRFDEFKKEKFAQPLTYDKMVRYVVFCYHKESPLVRRMMEIGARKERALAEAGFIKDGEWPAQIKAVLMNDNDLIIKMILQFLKFERSLRYANLMMLYERFWSITQASVGAKNSVKDSEDVKVLLDMIEAEEDKVFSGDKDLGDHVSAIQVMDRRGVISPEANATKIKAERKQSDRHKDTLKMLRQKD